MSKAIETLMHEHRVIEQVMGALETFAEKLDRGEDAGRETVGKFAEFFRNFADKCHHGKEEDRLFELMVKHGFDKGYGPIAVMLADHEEGRRHLKVLAEIGGATGLMDSEEKLQVSRHATAYIEMLRPHIHKEDNILYPMAEQNVPADEMGKLEAEFEEFEKNVMGEGTHEGFHRLAEWLIKAYPPDPKKMEIASQFMGCAEISRQARNF